MNLKSSPIRSNIKVIRINDQIRTIRQTSKSPLIKTRNFIQLGSSKEVVLQTSPNIGPIKIPDKSEGRRKTSIENSTILQESQEVQELRSHRVIPNEDYTLDNYKKSYVFQNQVDFKINREQIQRSPVHKNIPSPLKNPKITTVPRKTLITEKDSPNLISTEKSNKIMLGQIRRIKNRLEDDNDDKISEKSAKSIVWNETNLNQLFDQEYLNDLNRLDEFVLLYKYRYEKEHNKFMSRQQLAQHLKKLGIKCSSVNQEIFTQNFAFENKIQDEQNFKQFYQLALQQEGKKSFLPKIN